MSIDIGQVPVEPIITHLTAELTADVGRYARLAATQAAQIEMLLEHVSRLEQQVTILGRQPRPDVRDAPMPPAEGVTVP